MLCTSSSKPSTSQDLFFPIADVLPSAEEVTEVDIPELHGRTGSRRAHLWESPKWKIQGKAQPKLVLGKNHDSA